MSLNDLRNNEMMAHLLQALERGQDIGHYGRLVFAMVARHFLEEDELVEILAKSPGFTQQQALALVHQVRSRDYNPPRPERIAQWQRQQAFPICPSGDPDACNVYHNLHFPGGVYDSINQYHVEKAEAEMNHASDVNAQ